MEGAMLRKKRLECSPHRLLLTLEGCIGVIWTPCLNADSDAVGWGWSPVSGDGHEPLSEPSCPALTSPLAAGYLGMRYTQCKVCSRPHQHSAPLRPSPNVFRINEMVLCSCGSWQCERQNSEGSRREWDPADTGEIKTDGADRVPSVIAITVYLFQPFLSISISVFSPNLVSLITFLSVVR